MFLKYVQICGNETMVKFMDMGENSGEIHGKHICELFGEPEMISVEMDVTDVGIFQEVIWVISIGEFQMGNS